MNIKLYIHPMCSSSARVYAKLKEEGLLERVDVVSLDPGHDLMIDSLIPSVPALEVSGELVAVDPLEPEFVVAVLRNNRGGLKAYVPQNEGEAVERFAKSFIHSSYLMVLEYYSESALKAALTGSFALASIRAWFMEGSASKRLVTALVNNAEEIRERVNEYLEKAVAYAFLREVLLVFGGDRYANALNPQTALLWLQSKASVGRAHLDPFLAGNRETHLRKAERIVEVVKQREERWVPRLLKEFAELERFAREIKEYLG